MVEQNKCKIQRSGIVRQFKKNDVVIEISGKPTDVPNDKVAPGVRVGDEVQWKARCWTT